MINIKYTDNRIFGVIYDFQKIRFWIWNLPGSAKSASRRRIFLDLEFVKIKVVNL